MQQSLRRSSLVPTGFVVESGFCEADRTIITVRSSRGFGLCPSCGAASRRVHSHYQRRVTDLPLLGRIVQLMVIAAASAATPSCAGGKSSPNASLTVFWLPRRDARTFNEGLENATNTVGFIPGCGNGRLWRKADVHTQTGSRGR